MWFRENKQALAWSVYLSLAIWVILVSLVWTIVPWAIETKVAVVVMGFIITAVLSFYQLRRVWGRLGKKSVPDAK